MGKEDGGGKRQRSNSGSWVPARSGSPSPERHAPEAAAPAAGMLPLPAPHIPAAPPDARLNNPFGRINHAAEQRRIANVPPQNGFVTRTEQAIGQLPATSQLQTGFGPVGVSRGQAGQPMLTSLMGNYHNAQPPGGGGFTEYRQFVAALSGPNDVPGHGSAPHFALAMVHEMSGIPAPGAIGGRDPVPTHLQQRAMAMMVGTIGVAEEQRVDGAREIGLSVMRRVVTGQTTLRAGFTGDNPEFPMAGGGGADHTRQLAHGQRPPAGREQQGLSEWAPPGPRPRRWSI